MKLRSRPFSIRVLWSLAITTLIILGLHLLLQYLNLVVYGEKHGQIFEISNRLDMDDEASVATWFSQILFLAIGLSSFLMAGLQAAIKARRLWLIIGIVGLSFSIDEVAAIHELALQTLHLVFFGEAVPTIFSNAWWLVLPVILIVGAWLVKQLADLFPARLVGLLLAGGSVFISGAVFVDLLESTLKATTYLSQGVLVGVEESLELLGTILILYAIMDYLERKHSKELGAAIQHLRTKKK